MYADFFMFNRSMKQIVVHLIDQRDKSPPAFSLFYLNMNLASTYLLAFLVLIFLAIIGLIVRKCFGNKNNEKTNAFFTFLYNFFAFGAAFAGCISLQGALINPISFLNVNSVFYILGVLLYFSILC
jgi:hypothetical protein